MMNASGIVSISDNCGFFDIESIDTFEIIHPSIQLTRVIGRETGGVCYLDLVCPEDRDAVADNLRKIYIDGEANKDEKSPGRCIIHRMLMPNEKTVTVSLTFGYDRRGFLVCSVIRLSDDIGVDTVKKYRSNNVIESFAISMAIMYINTERQIIVRFANDEFYGMIGWNRLEFNDYFNECLGDDIIHPDDYEAFLTELTSVGEENRKAVFETRLLTMNGDIRNSEVHVRFLETENEDSLVSAVFADITERKRLKRKLLIENERFNILQNNSEMTVFDYDTEKDVCTLCGNVAHIVKYLSVYRNTGHPSEVVIDDFIKCKYALNIMSKDDYVKLYDSFANAIIDGKDGEFEFEASVIGQNYSRWFKCTFSAVKDDHGSVIRIVGKIRNYEKQKRMEQMLEKRIKSDMLTGLLNKETAKEQISEYLSSQGALAVDTDKYHVLMVIDLDDFHLVNECFGHTFGDNVLKEFASDIKSSFRDTDIVCRLVGDRYMVLMKNVTQKFAVKKAGRLCRSLIKTYGVQNTITVSSSIGVAFFGKDASDFEGLYQCAESATYEAKKNGKSAYCIYDRELNDDYSLIKEFGSVNIDDSAPSVADRGDIDVNLMDIAFSLLTTSDDIYGALDILIRTVGKKYNLSTVSIYIKGYSKDGRLKKVCRWISNRNIPTRNGRSPLMMNHVNIDQELGSSGIRCISDISTSSLDPHLKNMLKNDGMIAMVFCGLSGRAGKNFGYMVFNQFERKRKWSQKETNTFRYLAKIVSIALSEKYEKQTIIAESIEDLPPKKDEE